MPLTTCFCYFLHPTLITYPEKAMYSVGCTLVSEVWDPGVCSQNLHVWNLPLPVTSCVIVGKLLNVSDPRPSHLELAIIKH